MRVAFKDNSFAFEFVRNLGFVYYGGADLGEMMAAAGRIKEGDFESWFAEWDKLAHRILSRAKSRKHDGGPFNGIAPTGKSGTSVENFILRIENGMVTRWDVADGSLDLAIYLHDVGIKMPTFVEPPALIKGVALPS
jgi:hypothetical protein